MRFIIITTAIFVSNFLVFILLSRLAPILHLHTKLKRSFRHCFLLLIVRCPLLFCLKVPPVKPPLCLYRVHISIWFE
ncbi:hypothetical protein Hanom_Chr12g01066611 [Helianthus anomalus]